MRALTKAVVDVIWAAVEPLLPVVRDSHPLGCHRPRRQRPAVSAGDHLAAGAGLLVDVCGDPAGLRGVRHDAAPPTRRVGRCGRFRPDRRRGARRLGPRHGPQAGRGVHRRVDPQGPLRRSGDRQKPCRSAQIGVEVVDRHRRGGHRGRLGRRRREPQRHHAAGPHRGPDHRTRPAPRHRHAAPRPRLLGRPRSTTPRRRQASPT